MLSFTPSQKIENRLKILQGLFAETYKDLEALSPDETKYIHRCAFISNIGASTRIENAVLTDQEIEWVDTTLNDHGMATVFSESASTVLNCFRSSPEKRLKVGDIVEKTGIPRRTVQYALKTLTKQKLLQILGRGAGSRYQLVF